MAAITSDRSRSEQEARGQREHRSKHSLVQKGVWPGGKAPWGYDLLCVDQHGSELWRLVHEPGQYKRRCEYPDGSVRRYDGKDNVPARNKGEVQLRSLLGQIRQTRDVMATALPLKKGEAVRKVVAQIRVQHELRMMGKLRASRLIGVEIIPAVGETRQFPVPTDETLRGESSRARG
jgi:hypothetical protein